MSWLLFERVRNRIYLFKKKAPDQVLIKNLERYKDLLVNFWPAHNETTRNAKSWPNGCFKIKKWVGKDGFRTDKIESGPQRLNQPFGSVGRFEFDVYPNTNYQVHAGRWAPTQEMVYNRDKTAIEVLRKRYKNNSMPKTFPLSEAQKLLSMYPTQGCIRTSEEAMIIILKHHQSDSIEGIWVINTLSKEILI